MSDWSYVTAAYAVTWLAILGHQVYLIARGRAVKREAVERSEFGGRS